MQENEKYNIPRVETENLGMYMGCIKGVLPAESGNVSVDIAKMLCPLLARVRVGTAFDLILHSIDMQLDVLEDLDWAGMVKYIKYIFLALVIVRINEVIMG